MTTFLTGSTGFLGSYVVTRLLQDTSEDLALLVRAPNSEQAVQRLWAAWQVHMDFDEFRQHVEKRVHVFLGDITQPALGLEPPEYDRLAERIDSIIHIAASLNRKSEKAALNVNLRGTLAVTKLALAARERGGLRRFSDVSTTAVAGRRFGEDIFEDDSIEWSRDDYDPYARSKKFCEHMLHELLGDIPHTVFRPSIVLGDSQRPITSQFDMLRAFVFLAKLPIIPLAPQARMDIVPADYVGKAIAAVHMSRAPKHDIYHLSSGQASLRAQEIVASLRLFGKPLRGRFVERLSTPTGAISNFLADTPRSWGLSKPAMLLKVFWPYITFDTVFDNSRIIEALAEAPAPCTDYISPVMDFGLSNNFRYPYLPWPEGALVEARQ